MGGPRAWYCPSCRVERKKAAQLKYKRYGTARPIGSTDRCQVCGKEYVVNSSRQKYCKDCAEAAVQAVSREQSRAWNHSHFDYDRRTQQRHDATAEIRCVICGQSFRPGAGSPMTCSRECAKELARRKNAEWERAHKAERAAAHKRYKEEKESVMTPEEYRAYREAINAKARAAYHRRKMEK